MWYHYYGANMRLITRNTDYAIRALCYIARDNGDEKIISASELVKNLKIPRPFLRKILQTLNKNGVLKSYKGKGGGFSMAVSPENLRLVNLMEIFQGPSKVSECLFKKKICPDIRTCILRKKIGAIERLMTSELKSITLASLLKEGKR
jgi:Rrf2 family protein